MVAAPRSRAPAPPLHPRASPVRPPPRMCSAPTRSARSTRSRPAIRSAALAAHRILESGGNPVDAGAAAGICLGVVHSDIVSFAGVAPLMVYEAGRREVTTISGLGVWPRAATLEYFRDRCQGDMPDGLLRTVVPAAPDAWITALERFGTLGFAEVAQPAIEVGPDRLPARAVRRRDHPGQRGRVSPVAHLGVDLPAGRPAAARRRALRPGRSRPDPHASGRAIRKRGIEVPATGQLILLYQISLHFLY